MIDDKKVKKQKLDNNQYKLKNNKATNNKVEEKEDNKKEQQNKEKNNSKELKNKNIKKIEELNKSTKEKVEYIANKNDIIEFKKLSKEKIGSNEELQNKEKNNAKKNNSKTSINSYKNNKIKVKQNKKKRKRKLKVKAILIFVIMIIAIVLISVLIIQKRKEHMELEKQEKLLEEIESHYNEYVITETDANIYELIDNKYIKAGKIRQGEELTLSKIYVTYKDEYFEIESFKDKYYIHYKDVKKINSLTEIKQTELRYKKYILFNSNIITKEITNFYDELNNLVYSFNKSFELPIIIKKDNIYGVEYNNKLLYVKKDDVKEIIDNKNTDKENTKGIAVLNYHFFNNSDDPNDSCNQIICLSTNNLEKHLKYIKDNNIFTPTMKELEMYIDGYIQLPKSVVLTIDDGWRAKIGSEVMTKYEINATIFLMSKYYDPRNYQNEYIEVHSHGYDIHNGGMCPGGQGGEIKCMERTKLLADLKASRDKLNNTTYFCYPFYEYNEYSISVLKDAGFTMAFGGTGENGYYKVKPGINKFKLPRYVIYNYTTANTIATYID